MSARVAARLPQAFYLRDALDVAADLLGMLLVRGGVALRITEVEAYRPGDSASHCRAGRTERNAPMWGPGGHDGAERVITMRGMRAAATCTVVDGCF